IKDYISNIKTQDIDFLIENVNKPRDKVDIIGLFLENGFEVEMCANEVYKIIKDDFEIEFLVNMKGGAYYFTEVPALMLSNVQALPHLGILLIDSLLVDYKGYNVRIPNPYNYIYHKMIINDKRGNKAEKDRFAVINLITMLDDDISRNKLEHYYSLLTKKEKNSVRGFVSRNGLEIYFPWIELY
ncbi:MAG TPA: GSU2403 family nucleotidyltransferase fold protein, partial [Clostridia bacterium]|nr:GSU2403 family nucleotidyltransferase fold protein [Clostridia bacterium]